MKKINRFGKFDLLLDLKQQGVSDINVLNIIEDVDRSLFIDTNLKEKSNLNVALPIECGQTISQPLIVAHMTQLLEINKRVIGLSERPYIIAEVSANHNGCLEKAKESIKIA